MVLYSYSFVVEWVVVKATLFVHGQRFAAGLVVKHTPWALGDLGLGFLLIMN